MTSDDLFTLLASPTARQALLTELIPVACNDDEKPVDRPCEQCGKQFDSGCFLIVDGRVVDITCSACNDLERY